jgi:hypothetical protein
MLQNLSEHIREQADGAGLFWILNKETAED